MDKKACIFDMDGTLVDSMGYWRRLGREFLARKGVTENVEPVLERIKPMTMLESSALFIESFGLDGTPEELAAEMNRVMDDHYRRDIPLKPGAREYLEVLKKQGVSMCLATATPEPLSRLCMERLGVAEDFAFILSCETLGVGKDRPDVYLEAARRLGAVPAETAVLEDAILAARTAKAAGFHVVAVYDDSSAANWAEFSALADESIRDWEQAQ